jgi:iron complex outermembrane receptor protein
VKPLLNQTGNTVEIGAKWRSDRVTGSVSLYRSLIRNEFLLVELVPATTTSASVVSGFNASPTKHQGVEAGLDVVAWRGDAGEIRLRQSYTYNDFRFRGDRSYGTNQLPGVPRHLYQAELQLNHATGLYLSGSVQAASSYYVDYADSLKAPGYAIWGARLGYQPKGSQWSVFADLSNIGDRHYVAAISPVLNAGGKDTAAFYPGDGRAFVLGANVHF